jgi:hypothetical protein
MGGLAMDNADDQFEFPLFVLQPVADARHSWVAMLFAARTPPGQDLLERLCDEFHLQEALDGLLCASIRAKSCV